MVGRVNCWLIDDDPLTLVDTGPNSGKALDELEQGLRALGRSVEDLGLIVVTHQHIDHLGLVEILARRSGAEVAALDPHARNARETERSACVTSAGIPWRSISASANSSSRSASSEYAAR